MKISAKVMDAAVEAFEARPDLPTRDRLRLALRATDAMFPDTEVMGAIEAAEEVKVRTPNLRKLHGLPDPYNQVRSGPFWIADDIRKFARKRERARTNSN